MENRTRRKYSPEFKREAVQLANNPGQSVAGVARDVGIKANLLRRELAQVKKERDFLKHAAGGWPPPSLRRKASEIPVRRR